MVDPLFLVLICWQWLPRLPIRRPLPPDQAKGGPLHVLGVPLLGLLILSVCFLRACPWISGWFRGLPEQVTPAQDRLMLRLLLVARLAS
jgi:hypothetical protein